MRRLHKGSGGFFRREDERDGVLRRRVDVALDVLRDEDRPEDDRLELDEGLRFVMRLSLYTIKKIAGSWTPIVG